MEKLPQIEKIYEALSAIEDNRVNISDGSASAKSSDYKKEYKITWKEDVYSSNDNVSYWGGYAGYPIIAVLMLQGKLPMPDADSINLLKGINWKELNTKHKNKYNKAVAEIIETLEREGKNINALNSAVKNIFEAIKTLDISTKRSSIRPPKSNQ